MPTRGGIGARNLGAGPRPSRVGVCSAVPAVQGESWPSSPVCSQTSDPELGALTAASRDLRPTGVPALAVEGPSALRPFLAAALADGGRTVLAVTATDREAEDLGGAVADLLGRDAVAVLPSWETLPHERLSPRPDTVGRRLSIFRSLADPATAPRLVVAAARSLIQPIAPGLGRLEPVTLRVGDTHDFDGLLVRLVELAYTRVEMVTARGEFAVRGGIVDVFPPTAEHPVRVEFWGDEVSELRSFAVADQRSVVPVEVLHAPGCRELLLTVEVRDRAAALARTHENNPRPARAAGAPRRGHPGRGHGVADPGAGRRSRARPAHRPAAGRRAGAARRSRAHPHPQCGPGPHGPGVPRGELVHSGVGGDAPIDVGASAYRGLDEVLEHAASTGRPVVTLSPLVSGRDDVFAPAVHEVESYRGDTDRALTDLRAHVATGGVAVLVVAGPGTAQRAIEQLRDADVPAKLVERLSAAPEPGLVTVTCGSLTEGLVTRVRPPAAASCCSPRRT